MLVFANKTDVNGCMDEAEIQQVCVPLDESDTGTDDPVKELRLDGIKTHKWHIVRCSAVTGHNLHEGLAWVVQDAKARLFLY